MVSDWFFSPKSEESSTFCLQTTGKKSLPFAGLNSGLLSHPYCFMVQVLNISVPKGKSFHTIFRCFAGSRTRERQCQHFC